MTIAEYKKAVLGIMEYMHRAAKGVDFLSVEYVGGEILLYPFGELKEIVEFTREFFARQGITVHDGAQTNLIGSARRIEQLNALFEGRISTSFDDFTGQRTVNGDPDKYKDVFFRAQEVVNSHRVENVPGVFTIDETSNAYALEQLEICEKERKAVTFRPVFSGGKSNLFLDEEMLSETYLSLYNQWVHKSSIIAEPFFTLFSKRMSSLGVTKEPREPEGYCPHQSNCANRSLSLEPNGDIYICQDMADAGLGRLGNAISMEIDWELFGMIESRPMSLSTDCFTCNYYADCRGGCMLQSIQHGQGFHGKSNYCSVWKALFFQMDKDIINDPRKSLLWFESLSPEKAAA